jgi:hypothetical protein
MTIIQLFRLSRRLREFDTYLTKEVEDFHRSELIAKRKGYGSVIIHTTACHDSYLAAQAVYRSYFLPEKMNGEQRLIAYFVSIVNRAIFGDRTKKGVVPIESKKSRVSKWLRGVLGA